MGSGTHFLAFNLVKCLISASFFIVINAKYHTNDTEIKDEHSFNYNGNSSKGPINWGNLNKEWKACKSGKLQSPIDLGHRRVKVLTTLGNLRRTYKFAPAVVKNRGHDIMVQWKGNAGGTIINGTRYKLQQCHWHTPSEHTIDGKRFKMELHMVHINSEGEIAVVGILYKLGHPDTFLDQLIAQIRSTHQADINEVELDVGSINPREIKFGSRKYFRYLGSLTVPPCTEGVFWTILWKVRTTSMGQIRALRKAVHDGFKSNSRPAQPMGETSICIGPKTFRSRNG